MKRPLFAPLRADHLLPELTLCVLGALCLTGCFTFSVDPELSDCFNDDCPVGERCVEGACAPVVDPADMSDPPDAMPMPADACLEGCGIPQAPICDTNPSPEVLEGLVELCGNEIDDDCDGTADEADDGVFYRPDPNSDIKLALGDPCALGQGVCASEGTVICDPDGAGARLSCNAMVGTPAESDICNTLDDDCDGRIDEETDGLGEMCTSGLGQCQRVGLSTCNAEGEVICDAEPGPSGPEICDGVDQDCDGSTDEDFQIGEPCSVGEGACQQTGVYVCTLDNSASMCDAPEPGMPQPEVCDGAIDEDCDGRVDEDFADQINQPCTVGVGACERGGVQLCAPDGEGIVCGVEPGMPGLADQTCDGIDDDCDGNVDEAYVEIAQTLTCGEGVCRTEAPTQCVEAAVVEECTPGEPTGDDSLCNNIDEDCDGRIDEAADIVNIVCGEGVCAANGIRSCVGGEVQEVCTPGEPRGPDGDQQQCNAIDEDCDGNIDEGYVGDEVRCGLGACRTTTTLTCQNGQVLNLCQPGDPTGDDDDCDGIDDDCDGAIDERYPQTAIECGVGACVREGVQLCTDGAPVDECVPGDPVGADDDCNNIDDDCDGLVDEGYVFAEVACDDGARCSLRGRSQCIEGEERLTCRDGDPIIEGGNCNGVDEDCDGIADEEYIGGEACEVTGAIGACARGTTQCTGGRVQCRVSRPDEEACDGIDNDCDGRVDEDEQCQGLQDPEAPVDPVP
ncbi:MAG: MopE-related protein [Bradymonadia bacterium]